MFAKIIVLSFIFVLVSGFQSDDSLLKEVQEKYKAMNTLTADFHQEGVRGSLNGKFYYAKGNKLRVELEDRLIVTDGETIWSYNKKAGRVVVNSVENNPTSLSLEKYLFEYPEMCKVVSEELPDAFGKIIMIPDNSDLDFKKAELTVNSKKLIEKIAVTDLMGNEFSFRLTEIQINPPIFESLFTFNNTEDAEVIDLR